MNGIDISVSIWSRQFFDIAFFYRLLTDLPGVVGLAAMGPPVIYSLPTIHVPAERGFTGTTVMVQSHVAFHHWPDDGFIHLTISSCRSVDELALYRWLCKKFRGNRQMIKMKSVLWRKE